MFSAEKNKTEENDRADKMVIAFFIVVNSLNRIKITAVGVM